MSIADRITRSVADCGDDVFLRREFARFGSSAQVGRALVQLTREGVLVRLGVGVYAKAKPSVLTGKPIPVRPLEVLAPEVLQKLGVAVMTGRLTQDYNAGRSTQLPSGIVLNTGRRRITRKLSFNGKVVQYERASGVSELFGKLEWDATYDCKAERSRQRLPVKYVTSSPKLGPAQIKAAIAATPERGHDPECPYDPDDPKAVEAFWKNGAVVKGGGYAAVKAALAERRRPGQRGPGKRPPKEVINIRLSPEVVEAFRATGNGWQTRVDGALKDWLKTHKPA